MMMAINKHNLKFPEPLRGIEPGSFAESTIKIRLKAIGQRTIQENVFSEAISTRLKALVEDLPYGKIRPLQDQKAPDTADWQEYIRPYVGMNWLEVPWFFAETYFYRRILEATGFYSNVEGYGVDPYQTQKRLGLVNNRRRIKLASKAVEQWAVLIENHEADASRYLGHVLALSLWGNQADLSMWPAGEDNESENHPDEDLQRQEAALLVDDRERIQSYLGSLAGARVDFILDNSGLELVHDLLAVEFLLRVNLASSVVLHAKAHPTFVSDTVRVDIDDTLQFLQSDKSPIVSQAGESLRARLNSGQLAVKEHFYWNSPLAFWDAPAEIVQELNESSLVVVKGDANYRRFLGDRHWMYDTPVLAALGYLPFSFLALRVSKSEIMVGLGSGQVERMASKDPQWLVNGKWGMIQSAAV